jgi:hypothetical protein
MKPLMVLPREELDAGTKGRIRRADGEQGTMKRSSSSSSSSSPPSFFTFVFCCVHALLSALHCTALHPQCRSRCLCQWSQLLVLVLRKWSFSSSHSLLSVANSFSHYYLRFWCKFAILFLLFCVLLIIRLFSASLCLSLLLLPFFMLLHRMQFRNQRIRN